MKGEKQDRKRNGKGVMIYLTNGLDNGISLPNNIKRIYEGDWVDDHREGQGYERYSNCNDYEGGFK
jgi:hypothetical protein